MLVIFKQSDHIWKYLYLQFPNKLLVVLFRWLYTHQKPNNIEREEQFYPFSIYIWRDVDTSIEIPIVILALTLAVPVRFKHPDNIWKFPAILFPSAPLFLSFRWIYTHNKLNKVEREVPFCTFPREKERDIHWDNSWNYGCHFSCTGNI